MFAVPRPRGGAENRAKLQSPPSPGPEAHSASGRWPFRRGRRTPAFRALLAEHAAIDSTPSRGVPGALRAAPLRRPWGEKAISGGRRVRRRADRNLLLTG